MYGEVARLGLEQPAMFLLSGGAASSDLAEQAGAMPEMAGGGSQKRDILQIKGARHFNFTDYSVMFSPALRLLGALGPMDGRRGLEVTGAYVREFFGHHLLAQPAPLLAGPSSL